MANARDLCRESVNHVSGIHPGESGAQGRSLSAIRGLRDTGASVHNGRSRPSVACATPVHPCTMESNHRHADFQSAR
jgi:hypothetical protein